MEDLTKTIRRKIQFYICDGATSMAQNTTVIIKAVSDADRPWVLQVMREWGADFIVSRGRRLYPARLPGFYAESSRGEKIGLATHEITNGACELVTLDAFVKLSGVGTMLLEKVRDTARENGCGRLWLITTNDNLDAIRFYQRRGFLLAAIHRNAIARSRVLKPSIPTIGQYGIPMRDEIELEMPLPATDRS